MIADFLAVCVVALAVAALVVGFVASVVTGNWFAAIAIAGGVAAGWWLVRS